MLLNFEIDEWSWGFCQLYSIYLSPDRNLRYKIFIIGYRASFHPLRIFTSLWCCRFHWAPKVRWLYLLFGLQSSSSSGVSPSLSSHLGSCLCYDGSGSRPESYLFFHTLCNSLRWGHLFVGLENRHRVSIGRRIYSLPCDQGGICHSTGWSDCAFWLFLLNRVLTWLFLIFSRWCFCVRACLPGSSTSYPPYSFSR